jgi:hypothetical protein
MNGRERTRLSRARENGYLDAGCVRNQALVRAYGLWCWRLKIPMVWLERRTRYSRYGRVQLEMFTSANRLTAAGQAGMKAICAPANIAQFTRVSPHDASWDHVALANSRELAHAVFRAAVRTRNHEANEDRLDGMEGRNMGKLLRMASA